MAGQGQVVEVVGREMLPGYNVLQMVSKLTAFLSEPAVLTAISSPPAYALANGQTSRRQKALRLQFENCDQVRAVDQGFIFGVLIGRKFSVVRAFR